MSVNSVHGNREFMRDSEFFPIIEDCFNDLQFPTGKAKRLGDCFPGIVRQDEAVTAYEGRIL